jgi:glycosyltransferase involved in cell wall biosynthesis
VTRPWADGPTKVEAGRQAAVTAMKFSVCIPNFNYARYIGLTVDTVLEQSYADLEVHVADNHSSDGSMDVLASIEDPRFSYHRNNRNVGFAANLARAVNGTTGDWIILLSSDDLMGPDALQTYHDLIQQCGGPHARLVISSTCQIINANGDAVGLQGPPRWCWHPEDIDRTLSTAMGVDVYRLPADEVLARSLEVMRTPVWFASTCYPRALYDQVEGFTGQPLYNPDKEFHWRVIAAADSVIFIDRPLFGYRVHASNQERQQSEVGALKRLVDQYVSTFNTDALVRERAGVTDEMMARNFIREDIAKRAVLSLIERDLTGAQRTISMGRACYPRLMRTDPMAVTARALVATRWLTAPALARVGPRLFRRQLALKSVVRQALTDTPA